MTSHAHNRLKPYQELWPHGAHAPFPTAVSGSLGWGRVAPKATQNLRAGSALEALGMVSAFRITSKGGQLAASNNRHVPHPTLGFLREHRNTGPHAEVTTENYSNFKRERPPGLIFKIKCINRKETARWGNDEKETVRPWRTLVCTRACLQPFSSAWLSKLPSPFLVLYIFCL